MKGGILRHLVRFENLVVDLDSDGQQVERWEAAFPVPISAEIRALLGRELIAAQAVQSNVTGTMKVRYRPGFKASMRAIHRGAIYNIHGVVPDPESTFEYITLFTSTGVNEG